MPPTTWTSAAPTAPGTTASTAGAGAAAGGPTTSTASTATATEPPDEDDEAGQPKPLRDVAGRYWTLLAIPLGLGLALRLGLAVTDHVISNDSSAYLESGRNLVDGRGFVRDGGFPELHFPPIAPFFLGGAWKLSGSPLFAVSFVTMAFSFLALLPLAGLARRIGGDRAGLAACWVGALAPGLARVPANAGGGSEVIYLTFLLTCLWLVSTLPSRSGRGVWLTSAAAGLSAGALYLTRPEGLLLVLVIVAVTALTSGVVGDLRRREVTVKGLVARLGPPTVMFVVFVACMAPYLVYLHHHTGKWEVTAKSQDANLEAWRAVAEGDRRGRDAVLYELDESGLRFVERSESLTALARNDPAGYLGIVGVNGAELRKTWIDPQWTPWNPVPRWSLLPLPLTLLGLWAAWKGRRDRRVVLLAAVVGLATATALGFFVLPRYLIPAVGVLCALAGLGLVRLRPSWRRWAFYGALVLLVVPIAADIPRDGGMFRTREPVEHQIAGEWLADNAPAGSRIMTRSLVTEFYSARKAVAMPYGSVRETVRFAYHHGVDYLVADEYSLNRMRPQLAPLFEDGPWPGLRLEHEFTHRGRLTRIFALDPPPPVKTPDPPGLGFVGDG